MKVSLSIIITALDEEQNLESNVKKVVSSVAPVIEDFEIIIINDGSHDKTRAIADRLARQDRRISAYHNAKNMGIGYSYKRGVSLAKKRYVVWMAADDAADYPSFRRTLTFTGQADLIIPYITNKELRSKFRNFVSNMYVDTLNLLFGLDINYYTSYVIIRKYLVRDLTGISNGFTYMPEIVVILVRRGCSYKQVPLKQGQRPFGKSKMFRPKNIALNFFSIAKLIYRIYFIEARHNKN